MNNKNYRRTCVKNVFQNYNNYNTNLITYSPYPCLVNNTICIQNDKFINKQFKQQIKYSNMCKFPNKFPITSNTQKINLSKSNQRIYSNLWWRRLGSSQSTPTVSGWPGIAITGSDVPYSN